ncbi:MAG: hypothetical protein BWY68_00320 [bacterium ADurb.Bin400]|nr:MAG: hypothetical protein BWY68_00320 [bacterium ADurb.Bin400]
MEAKIIGRINGSSRIEEKKKLFYNDSAACRNHYYTSRILSSEPWAASSSIQAPYMVINNNHYEITNIKNALWGSVQVADAELFIKPVGNGIEYKFVHSGIGTAYGPASVIRSHGYYMGVGRKLEARIDRQSGTLYDLFDYVIYQAD